MATKRPLVLYDGEIKELESEDTLAEVSASPEIPGDSGLLLYNDDGYLGATDLEWDSVNGWLGVGKTPTCALDVDGDIKASNLGDLSEQDSDDVSITGGEISGLTTPLPVASGGTGASTAQAALNSLTQVSGAGEGHVLVKDVDGDASWASPDSFEPHVIKDASGNNLTARTYLKFDHLAFDVTDDAVGNTTKVGLHADDTPTAWTIPMSGEDGKLDAGWVRAGSTSQTGLVQLSTSLGSSDAVAATEGSLSKALAQATQTQKLYAIIFG